MSLAPDLDKLPIEHTLAETGLARLADDVRRSNRLRFSFTRPVTAMAVPGVAESEIAESERAVAEEHFGHVVRNLLARRQIERELAEVMIRFRDTMNESDYAAQQRLIAERLRVDDLLVKLAAQERDADAD